MTATNSSTMKVVEAPLHHAVAAKQPGNTVEGNHALLIGWMTVLACLEQNVTATYGLENSESQLLSSIAQMTTNRANAMYGSTDPHDAYTVDSTGNGQAAPGTPGGTNSLAFFTWYLGMLCGNSDKNGNMINGHGDANWIQQYQAYFQETQLKGQNDMAPMNRESDQWSSTLQGNNSSTDSDYQNMQALISIAQTAANRA